MRVIGLLIFFLAGFLLDSDPKLPMWLARLILVPAGLLFDPLRFLLVLVAAGGAGDEAGLGR